jgi:hypothetical protein
MSKALFTPVSIAGGLVAGIIGKKLFERLWSVFGLVRGLFDHGARRAFSRATGAWPGEEAPDRA